jgi:hypothetical protein
MSAEPPRFVLPRLYRAAAAAAYLGISEGTLRTLPIPRKELGIMRFYDRADLDAFADSLRYEGETGKVNGCDEAWSR